MTYFLQGNAEEQIPDEEQPRKKNKVTGKRRQRKIRNLGREKKKQDQIRSETKKTAKKNRTEQNRTEQTKETEKKRKKKKQKNGEKWNMDRTEKRGEWVGSGV